MHMFNRYLISTICMLFLSFYLYSQDKETCPADFISISERFSQERKPICENVYFLPANMDNALFSIPSIYFRNKEQYIRRKSSLEFMQIFRVESVLEISAPARMDIDLTARLLTAISKLPWHLIEPSQFSVNQNLRKDRFYRCVTNGIRTFSGIPLVVKASDNVLYVVDLRSDYFSYIDESLAEHIVIYRIVYAQNNLVGDSSVYLLERDKKIDALLSEIYKAFNMVISDSIDSKNFCGDLIPLEIAEKRDATKFKIISLENYRIEYIKYFTRESQVQINNINGEIANLQTKIDSEKDLTRQQEFINELHDLRDSRIYWEDTLGRCNKYGPIYLKMQNHQ